MMFLFRCKVLVLVTVLLAVGQARHDGEKLDDVDVDGGGGGGKAPTTESGGKRRHHHVEDGKLTTEEEIEAAKRAKYYFSADVDDGISDLSQHRYEMRNGLDVKGYFSYSDGYQLRKVRYEADADGYRIISDEIQPLPGPQNHTGIASVSTNIDGSHNQYKVQRIKSRKFSKHLLNNIRQQDHLSSGHEQTEE